MKQGGRRKGLVPSSGEASHVHIPLLFKQGDKWEVVEGLGPKHIGKVFAGMVIQSSLYFRYKVFHLSVLHILRPFLSVYTSIFNIRPRNGSERWKKTKVPVHVRSTSHFSQRIHPTLCFELLKQ